MTDFIDSSATLDSRQFLIAVKRLADSLNYGMDSSPFRGAGLEYVESRPYQPGDPVKSIDWRVTARTRRIHVKEYEAPRQLPVYLLVDTSASMTVRSGTQSKYEQAVFVAGGIALACLDRLSPVGMMSVGARSLHVRPSLSKDQIMQWLHQLRKVRYDEHTRLAAGIAELSPRLTHRALIIVLSDLHDSESLPVLKQLSQRHDCVVLQFRDPAESSIRGAGFIRAREAESGVSFSTHGRVTWFDQERIADELARVSIDHLLIDVDRPYVHRLRHFFRFRGVLTRGAR
jgi:uncharacterized protein (DUF58 family)